MNAKGIYEVLAAIGVSASMAAGCNSSPAPTTDVEVKPEAKGVHPANPSPVQTAVQAPVVQVPPVQLPTAVAPPPMSTGEKAAPVVATAPPPPAQTAATAGRSLAAPRSPVVVTADKPVPPPPVAIATVKPVEPVKAGAIPTATATAKTTKKGGAEMKCGEGACG